MPNSTHVSRGCKKQEKAAYKAEKNEIKEERLALHVHNGTKTGVHNCPEKDAGTTHAFRARCFKLGHAGYCPACGGIYSCKHGCKQHEYRGEQLLEKCPSEEEKRQFRADNGIEEPNNGDAEEAEAANPPGKNGKGKKGKKKSSGNKRG